jgi:hypothetical protein
MQPRLALSVLFLHAMVHAQNVTSSVNGVLVDQSGAGIPGAICTLSNPDGGITLKTISESTALFTFPAVGAGTIWTAGGATG